MATLTVPDHVPSPAEDADQLHKAFQGWGTNEKLIITTLAHRNAPQRKLIREAYVEKYGEDLLKALQKELSSDFERAVLLWTVDPAERDALLANEAVRKWHPGNVVLIEISCTRSPKELLLSRKAYHDRFKRSLEEDVAAHTNGSFRKLLVPLVSVYRYDGTQLNTSLAKSEAKLLHEKISHKAYDDEEVIRIISTRSKLQLGATFNSYNDLFGHQITEDLNGDSDNEFLTSLRVAVSCLICPEKYFEQVLRLAINKLGTDEEALTRVVTTRAEVDLNRIKEEYFKRNSVSLSQAIKGDTSGDYADILIALVGQ